MSSVWQFKMQGNSISTVLSIREGLVRYSSCMLASGEPQLMGTLFFWRLGGIVDSQVAFW